VSDQALLAAIAEIGRRLPANATSELAAAVSAAGSGDRLAVRADGLSTQLLQKQAVELASAWKGSSMSAESVAAGLRAAQTAAAVERSAETVDLVWTGPKSTKVPVAMNAEALLEVIKEAKARLLIVSYATWDVPKVVEMLGAAVETGVDVDMVLEFHGAQEGGEGWDAVKGLGGALPDAIRIFHWPPELRPKTDWGKQGYLHVKCAVADGRIAFVSSANLTAYAMEMNMELGVVVRGGEVPVRIAAHFAALIDEGILQRWDG